MLHEIKIKKDYNDHHMEGDITKKISKERFFLEMENYNINIKNLIENIKTDLNGLANFNHFLHVVKTNHKIGIYESVLILEDEQEFDLKKLMSLLNSDNMNQMEFELAEKYKLKKSLPSLIDSYFIF